MVEGCESTLYHRLSIVKIFVDNLFHGEARRYHGWFFHNGYQPLATTLRFFFLFLPKLFSITIFTLLLLANVTTHSSTSKFLTPNTIAP